MGVLATKILSVSIGPMNWETFIMPQNNCYEANVGIHELKFFSKTSDTETLSFSLEALSIEVFNV